MIVYMTSIYVILERDRCGKLEIILILLPASNLHNSRSCTLLVLSSAGSLAGSRDSLSLSSVSL